VICDAQTRDGGRCQAHPVRPGGRCWTHGGASTGPRTASGKARRSAYQRALAVRQHEEARAEKGKAGLGELSDEGRAAIVAGNLGRPKPAEQRAKMSDSHNRRHEALCAAQGAMMLSSLYKENVNVED
jgi:hypothetical protein